VTPKLPPRAGLAALALLVFATACERDPGPVLSEAGHAPPPAAQVAALRCSASVHAQTVSCADAPASPGGARANRIVGGQNVDVKLTSSGVAYDSLTEVFAFDVTLQNLMVQRMGTDDGATVTGTQVFFHGGPTVTAGTGTVTVANAHGVGAFTGTAQPYFDYPGTLPYQAVSAPVRWELSVPRSVAHFDFVVYVHTRLVPTVVFDMSVGGNRDIYRIGMDGNDLARITTSAGDDRDPTAAGGTVVFTSLRDGNAELYSVPLQGGAETRLTSTTHAESTPALSPDGTRLAYSRAPGTLGRIWTSAPDGSGAAPATNAFAAAGDIESSPAWASSTRLAFVSTHNGSSDVWEMTVGSDPAFLTGHASAADVAPAWRPDGGQVVFASNRADGTELYLLTVSSGAVTRLTERARADAVPRHSSSGATWTSDGRLVYACNISGVGARVCWLDPAAPAIVTQIPTPAAAERPFVLRR
jgi:WD40-like Beta Propeller Repeat